MYRNVLIWSTSYTTIYILLHSGASSVAYISDHTYGDVTALTVAMQYSLLVTVTCNSFSSCHRHATKIPFQNNPLISMYVFFKNESHLPRVCFEFCRGVFSFFNWTLGMPSRQHAPGNAVDLEAGCWKLRLSLLSEIRIHISKLRHSITAYLRVLKSR
jgi:hypothetical protein